MAKYKILSLDGGGVRGILTARILQRLQNVYAELLTEVNLIAGTSAGAIIAVLLAKGTSPSEIVEAYRQSASQIFSDDLFHQVFDLGGVIGAKYSTSSRYQALQPLMGDLSLGELQTSVLIPTFDLDSAGDLSDLGPRRWKPKLFHNFPGNNPDTMTPAIDVVMRSTAAPTYFPIYQGYIDGGVAANNPSMCALAQAIDPFTGAQSLADIVMLSVGSGRKPQYVSCADCNWGLKQWGFDIIDLLFDASMGLADFHCRQLLGPSRYCRINPNLPYSIPLDDAAAIPMLLETADQVPLDAFGTWIADVWLA